jgi:hypothetical protein
MVTVLIIVGLHYIPLLVLLLVFFLLFLLLHSEILSLSRGLKDQRTTENRVRQAAEDSCCC